jgi:hypothetical protein
MNEVFCGSLNNAISYKVRMERLGYTVSEPYQKVDFQWYVMTNAH